MPRKKKKYKYPKHNKAKSTKRINFYKTKNGLNKENEGDLDIECKIGPGSDDLIKEFDYFNITDTNESKRIKKDNNEILNTEDLSKEEIDIFINAYKEYDFEDILNIDSKITNSNKKSKNIYKKFDNIELETGNSNEELEFNDNLNKDLDFENNINNNNKLDIHINENIEDKKDNVKNNLDIKENFSNNLKKFDIPFINALQIIPNTYIEKVNEKIIKCNNIKYKKYRINKYKNKKTISYNKNIIEIIYNCSNYRKNEKKEKD